MKQLSKENPLILCTCKTPASMLFTCLSVQQQYLILTIHFCLQFFNGQKPEDYLEGNWHMAKTIMETTKRQIQMCKLGPVLK